MRLQNRIQRNTLLVLALIIAISSCQKLAKPALGDYPKDTNPPGGPLKFFAAMDGSSVDSIRANFGTDHDVSYAPGVSGMAVQFDGTKNGYIDYPAPNEFGSSTSFTISFWMNITLAQKDHVNADGVLAVANTVDFWGNITIFVDHESSTSDSMPLKIVFNLGPGDSATFQMADYFAAHRWPHMYDGTWHHVAFTYDAASATITSYRDGVQLNQQVLTHPAVFANSSKLILGGFQEASGIVSKYSDNTWMSGFPGLIDNVRLYGTALAPADVAALYAGKQ